MPYSIFNFQYFKKYKIYIVWYNVFPHCLGEFKKNDTRYKKQICLYKLYNIIFLLKMFFIVKSSKRLL